MRETKCKRILECKLTTLEYVAKAKEMSQTMTKQRAAENKLKAATSQIKAEVEQLKGETDKLQVIVSTGVEFREIECVVTYDWDAKTKSITRPDTGEVVEADIIPECDLQEHMDAILKENEVIERTPENDAAVLAAEGSEAEVPA